MDAKRRDNILRILSFLLWVFLLVDGVSSDEKPEEMFVTEGQSVTLPGLTGIQSNDTIVWKFKGSILFRVSEANNIHFKTKDERLKDRLTLDHKTGSLTITKITSEDTGDYELQIKNTKENPPKRFSVIVRGVKIRMEGDTLSLFIDVKEQKVDNIQWMFGDQVIPTDGLNPDGIWSNVRLNRTGELFITKIRRDQFGVYKVKINTSSSIVHGEFHVTVDSRNSGAGSAISGASVALMVWSATVFLLQV